MAKKTTDPFMSALWEVLVADQLGPAGQQSGWAETNVRIRNRFIRAVRQVLQSGAAFQASAIEVRITEKTPATKAAAGARKTRGKRHDPRELQLPLMSSVAAQEKKRSR
jgi:hypothetical protein